MKTLHLILLIPFLLIVASCNYSSKKLTEERQEIQKMKVPIIIIAIEKASNGCINNGAITLLDGSGKLFIFPCYTEIAGSISSSRQVGDTIAK